MQKYSKIYFSIVIPTLNQSRKLSQCLDALCKLNFDQDRYEIIIIDNGSIDDTHDVVKIFIQRKGCFDIRYIYCESPGLMAARHRGAAEAKGEIISFIDDDSIVHADWLDGIRESFLHDNVVLVGGPCIPIYEEKPPSWLQYFWVRHEFGISNSFLSLIDCGDRAKEIDPELVYGCNYSIRKDILFEIGGTYPDYLPQNYKEYQGSGESGVARKIAQKGKTFYNPRVRIHHLVPSERMTPEYFHKRAFFQGIGHSFQAKRIQEGIEHYHDPISLRSLLYKVIRKYYAMEKKIFSRFTKKAVEIMAKTITTRHEGYMFHQSRYEEDPRVREWVCRKNYLGDNEKLPHI